MNYVEYGKENSDVIILLHGGGLSWWNYKEVAERLQTDYHVVLPILDGHAGCDKQFTTIENNALDIIEFVNSKLGGSVLMMGGLSLGGQILLEILSQRKDICKYAIVESVLVIPSKFTYSMIKPAFGSCYGLIKYKWFSKLQFKSLRIKSNLFDEYYKDTCAIRKSDMIAFLQENSVYSLKDGIGECEATVQIYVGEKEKQSMKKSAKIIHEKLVDSISLDIKNAPSAYAETCGVEDIDINEIEKSLRLLKTSHIPFDLCVTLVNEFHNEKNIEELGQWIQGVHMVVLQPFQNNETTIDHSLHRPDEKQILKYKTILEKYVDTVKIRG